MQTLDRVRQTITRYRLAAPETRAVAAVSGGSDSVALVHLLKELHGWGSLQLVALAHFNHCLRATADADEQFCARLGTALGLPLIVDREDIGARARRERRSIESAAHDARHEFFVRSLVAAGADVVALGHTKDDQAETLLLRVIRGTGSAGLSAMHPRAGPLIRPLLDCRRDELKAYLVARKVAFVHDESNEDISIPRNRVRALLLPLLAQQFNPGIVDVLANEADVAREQWALLNEACDKEWPGVVRRDNLIWRLNAPALASLPMALARLLVHRAMTAASGGRSVGFSHVRRALELGALNGPRGLPFDAPGQRVERIGLDVVLRGRTPGSHGRPDSERGGSLTDQCPLPIPGVVEVAGMGCLVSTEMASSEVARDIPRTSQVAVVRRDSIRSALAVRSRRPGDRFRPIGLGGWKKLQDFFVDRKVARRERDRVPLVVDGQGRIVWVAGYAVDEAFRVTDASQPVVVFRVKAVGGSI